MQKMLTCMTKLRIKQQKVMHMIHCTEKNSHNNSKCQLKQK